MGMTHRGRLNVLANFLKKSLNVIFTEFTENYIPDLVAGDGDVKYHLGYRTVRKLGSGAQIEIRLSANPSHLEAVDPLSRERHARVSVFVTIPPIAGRFCLSLFMGTLRLRGRGSSRRPSTCRSWLVTVLAAPCT